MYYPVFRGRQSELLAIRATAALLAKNGRVVPVVEPVNVKPAALKTALEVCVAAKLPFGVVVNPSTNPKASPGDMLQSSAIDAALRSSVYVLPTFWVLSSARASDVQAFFKKYQGRDVVIVHYESPADARTVAALTSAASAAVRAHVFDHRSPQSYQAQFRPTRALLRDGFRRLPTNAHYSGEEFFSDPPSAIKKVGWDGCGDYSIVGDFFQEGGTTPKAIAIHLTYEREQDKSIWVHHFVSDSNTTQANIEGKFIEAARKVQQFARTNRRFASTVAVQELLGYLQQAHYPGLPKLKELSMRHHLEVMASVV